jgi:hypothetical protein
MSKQYIGDGAFVDFEGENVVLTTSDGLKDTNRIVLEPEVMAVFLIRVTHHRAKAQHDLEERTRCARCSHVKRVHDNQDGCVASTDEGSECDCPGFESQVRAG